MPEDLRRPSSVALATEMGPGRKDAGAARFAQAQKHERTALRRKLRTCPPAWAPIVGVRASSLLLRGNALHASKRRRVRLERQNASTFLAMENHPKLRREQIPHLACAGPCTSREETRLQASSLDRRWNPSQLCFGTSHGIRMVSLVAREKHLMCAEVLLSKFATKDSSFTPLDSKTEGFRMAAIQSTSALFRASCMCVVTSDGPSTPRVSPTAQRVAGETRPSEALRGYANNHGT